MRATLRFVFFLTLLLNGQATWATPRSDAHFIALREYEALWRDYAERKFKYSFVKVYFRPISARGIEIKDIQKFIDLIPDDEVSPYLDRFFFAILELYLSAIDSEEIAAIAEIMRLDETASINGILTKELEQKAIDHVEKTLANAELTTPDNPVAHALHVLVVSMGAYLSAFDEVGAELMAKRLHLGSRPLFIRADLSREIEQLSRPQDNPITIAAVKAKDVLSFANPAQRQSLLRILTKPESTDGLRSRFRRPLEKKRN